MKVPKLRKRLCPRCKTHTEHKVALAKRKAPNATNHQSRGSKVRQKGRSRGVGIGMGNRGRFSRPAIGKQKMKGKKLTKKSDFRYACSVCKYISVQSVGIRAKKIEMI